MREPFMGCSDNGLGLVSKVCRELSVRGHHVGWRMDFFTVAGRVCGDFGGLFPRAARAFELITNLLAAGTGCVEVFLCVSLDVGRTAPPGRNFVTELAEFVGKFRLIDGRGELLRGEETLRLNRTRLAVVALGYVENDGVGVQLWRNIAIDRAGGIVFKLCGDKLASGLCRMIAAD